MSVIKKHGIILFDGVNMRKNVSVNSSNLIYYTGIDDCGDEGVECTWHKEYADHALVFIFAIIDL